MINLNNLATLAQIACTLHEKPTRIDASIVEIKTHTYIVHSGQNKERPNQK